MDEPGKIKTSKCDKLKVSLYYITIVFFSHLIMFLLMTYNFGIIIIILLGNGVGFYLFGFKKDKLRLINNHKWLLKILFKSFNLFLLFNLKWKRLMNCESYLNKIL